MAAAHVNSYTFVRVHVHLHSSSIPIHIDHTVHAFTGTVRTYQTIGTSSIAIIPLFIDTRASPLLESSSTTRVHAYRYVFGSTWTYEYV